MCVLYSGDNEAVWFHLYHSFLTRARVFTLFNRVIIEFIYFSYVIVYNRTPAWHQRSTSLLKRHGNAWHHGFVGFTHFFTCYYYTWSKRVPPRQCLSCVIDWIVWTHDEIDWNCDGILSWKLIPSRVVYFEDKLIGYLHSVSESFRTFVAWTNISSEELIWLVFNHFRVHAILLLGFDWKCEVENFVLKLWTSIVLYTWEYFFILVNFLICWDMN